MKCKVNFSLNNGLSKLLVFKKPESNLVELISQFHKDSSSNYDWGSSEPALHLEKEDPESVEYSDSYSDDYEVDR